MKNILEKIHKTSERGQAIILIAFAIVGLVAIVGLMVDGGIMLIEYARLKRGVDAASIAAASQFRKDFVSADLEKAGEELLKLNQSDADVTIYTCDYPGTNPDPTLCSAPKPERKLVRVTASRRVNFGFMRIVGFTGTTITASAVGEAASIDMVLVIDTSASMAYETTGGVKDPNYDTNCFLDVAHPTTPADCVDPLKSDQSSIAHPNGDDPVVCNNNMLDPATRCEPLGTVKDVAIDFVEQRLLFYPYDRVAVISTTEQNRGGDRFPFLVLPFSNNRNDDGTTNTEIQDAIRGLKVFEPRDCPSTESLGGCLKYDSIYPAYPYKGGGCTPHQLSGGTDPSSCGASNIGGGLFLAGEQFAYARQESFWVVISLFGGPANATNPNGLDPIGFCPGTAGAETWKLPGGSGFCRDEDDMPPTFTPPTVTDWNNIGQVNAWTNYVTNTFDWSTYDWTTASRHDFKTDPTHYDADDYARDGADAITSPDTGAGATLFSICMGAYCRSYPNVNDPASAENLGRYMAEHSGGTKANHGLYYFSDDPAGLDEVFLAIGENIFTRISQ